MKDPTQAAYKTLDGKKLDPTILVIFGITGDLAKRKVLPALYHLLKDDLLPHPLEIIGTSRHELSVDELLKNVELCVLEADNICDPDALKKFRECVRMVKLDPIDDKDYASLGTIMDDIESKHGVCMNRLYYLSIPPQVSGQLIRHLGEQGLDTCRKHKNGSRSRLLVEKPFGYDLVSAEGLINEIAKYFSEDQVFRIDHYLAKESAQNILTFRRFNPLFSSLWNNQHIRSITVLASEKIDIEGRADFYEHVGAMRDLVQSHLLQLLALIVMDLPEDLTDSDAIHWAKQAILLGIRPPKANEVTKQVIRGQYAGYREEVGNPDSTTETFISVQLSIDSTVWNGVNIVLTTGKALKLKQTEITVCFGADNEDNLNKLTFRVQPNEGIDVQLLVKKPGFDLQIQPAIMDFSYEATFDEHGHPDAYERVLIDAIRGDHSLFATSQEVLASWHILQPILDSWQKDSSDLKTYAKGSNGPTIA